MRNCFTVTIHHLNNFFKLPDGWNGYDLNIKDMSQYVREEKRFLARKDHINFFKSFCDPVDKAERNDVVLTNTSVGVAINRFAYWTYNEDLKHIEHKMIDNDCLILRIQNG